MIDRTDPVNYDINTKLTPEELDKFWDRAWALGLVVRIPPTTEKFDSRAPPPPEQHITMDERLYIDQLKTCIRDLLVASKPRFGWRDIWNNRVKRAEELLRKRKRQNRAEATYG